MKIDLNVIYIVGVSLATILVCFMLLLMFTIKKLESFIKDIKAIINTMRESANQATRYEQDREAVKENVKIELSDFFEDPNDSSNEKFDSNLNILTVKSNNRLKNSLNGSRFILPLKYHKGNYRKKVWKNNLKFIAKLLGTVNLTSLEKETLLRIQTKIEKALVNYNKPRDLLAKNVLADSEIKFVKSFSIVV